MKILAVVTARQGSKRIPGKNSKSLHGKPLITWTIEKAKQLQEIDSILVSTDSELIAEISRESGALVPWLRPPELATDNASSIDTVLHAIDWYEDDYGPIDGVLLLQPTSPFRSLWSMREGLRKFRQNPENCVISVAKCEENGPVVLKYSGEYLIQNEFNDKDFFDHISTQPLFRPNGSFYLASPSYLRSHNSFFQGNLVPLFFRSDIENLDIDTYDDWMTAEALVDEWEALGLN
jgi:CMP-N-acetylneuraminic acid synthetase